MSDKMREALELIAAPMRADGTWDRDRLACQQLAIAALAEQPAQGEAVARIRTWAKDSQFTGKAEQHAELIDWENGIDALADGEHTLYTAPPAPAVPESLIAELESEANGWWQGKRATRDAKSAATGALTILDKLRKRLAAAPEVPRG